LSNITVDDGKGLCAESVTMPDIEYFCAEAVYTLAVRRNRTIKFFIFVSKRVKNQIEEILVGWK
jgi:hypothetical protein